MDSKMNWIMWWNKIRNFIWIIKKIFFYDKWESSSKFKENTYVTECPKDKQYIEYNNYWTEKCESEGL